MESEKINVCNEDGQHIGVASREEIHRLGLWHETFHCWIVTRENGKDWIHLQLRSKEKKDFPDLFDITAAGHILANEMIEDGVREVEEELGISVPFKKLISLGVIKDQIIQKSFIDNECCHVFLYKAGENIDDAFTLQKEEVAGMVKIEFQRFYDLCVGRIEEVEAEGFVMANEQQPYSFRKNITLQQLVPHSPDYLERTAALIAEKLKSERVSGMGDIDKRNRLDEKVFTYRISKNNTVFISYEGKEIKIVKGKEAERLTGRIQSATTDKEVQLALAKITGNFKRGNERTVNKK